MKVVLLCMTAALGVSAVVLLARLDVAKHQRDNALAMARQWKNIADTAERSVDAIDVAANRSRQEYRDQLAVCVSMLLPEQRKSLTGGVR